MVDYGKLIDEEKAREDSAIAAAEALKKREIDLVSFFRSVEINLGEEMARANVELKKRGAPVIEGPFRPLKDEEKIGLAFGKRRPSCRLTLQSTFAQIGISRIQVELFDETGASIGKKDYVIEGEAGALKAYQSLIEGFPDHNAEVSASEIAQEIVTGIIRGRFA
jgi:hypothetical protein